MDEERDAPARVDGPRRFRLESRTLLATLLFLGVLAAALEWVDAVRHEHQRVHQGVMPALPADTVCDASPLALPARGRSRCCQTRAPGGVCSCWRASPHPRRCRPAGANAPQRPPVRRCISTGAHPPLDGAPKIASPTSTAAASLRPACGETRRASDGSRAGRERPPRGPVSRGPRPPPPEGRPRQVPSDQSTVA